MRPSEEANQGRVRSQSLVARAAGCPSTPSFLQAFGDPRPHAAAQASARVDFVAERIDGQVVPIEVKFRKRIDAADWAGITHFRRRFDSPVGVLVTRDANLLGISGDSWQYGKLQIPLQDFLLAF
jgi:hypothetical protein